MARGGCIGGVAALRVALAAFAAVALSACNSPEIVCGGKVHPAGITPEQMRLVEVARHETEELCGAGGRGCDFSIYATRGGQTVRASRMSPDDNGCSTYFGDDQYVAFDEAGKFVKVINGL